nr:hypothetical protein [uncultured Roseovarius sp.]
MPTVAEIAAMAFGAVDTAIPDAIHEGTLSYEDRVAYDASTGAYASTEMTDTGRVVVDTSKPATDIFPDYIAGPGDELVMLEGFTTCKEGWTLTAGGKTWKIRQVQDILAAGSLFYAIAREVK